MQEDSGSHAIHSPNRKPRKPAQWQQRIEHHEGGIHLCLRSLPGFRVLAQLRGKAITSHSPGAYALGCVKVKV